MPGIKVRLAIGCKLRIRERERGKTPQTACAKLLSEICLYIYITCWFVHAKGLAFLGELHTKDVFRLYASGLKGLKLIFKGGRSLMTAGVHMIQC